MTSPIDKLLRWFTGADASHKTPGAEPSPEPASSQPAPDADAERVARTEHAVHPRETTDVAPRDVPADVDSRPVAAPEATAAETSEHDVAVERAIAMAPAAAPPAAPEADDVAADAEEVEDVADIEDAAPAVDVEDAEESDEDDDLDDVDDEDIEDIDDLDDVDDEDDEDAEIAARDSGLRNGDADMAHASDPPEPQEIQRRRELVRTLFNDFWSDRFDKPAAFADRLNEAESYLNERLAANGEPWRLDAGTRQLLGLPPRSIIRSHSNGNGAHA